MSKKREKRVEHGGWPHGLKFQPLKTNLFPLWAPKSFINQIAKNTSSSPAFPNLCTSLPSNVLKTASFSFKFLLNKLRPQRRQVVFSGNGNCFYPAVARRWHETSHEKHEEMSRSSSIKKSVISSGDLTD